MEESEKVGDDNVEELLFALVMKEFYPEGYNPAEIPYIVEKNYKK